MGLALLKARLGVTGATPREEMIKDTRDFVMEELENDPSFSTTAYKYSYGDDRLNPIGYDSDFANMRIYKRTYSSLNGNYQKFTTTFDNPILIGDYIHDTANDTIWLVNESFNIDDMYYTGKMVQCNYLVKWQDDDGIIFERYANIVSASKYDVGESGSNTIYVQSNNYTVLMGYSDYGLELEGKRIFIDIKSQNPTKVFKLTRIDDVLYNAGQMGAMLSFIADRNQYDESTDNQELRICDYKKVASSDSDEESSENTDTENTDEETENTNTVNVSISGSSVIRIGRNKTWTVSITDDEGNEVDTDYSWFVSANFDVDYTTDEKSISLSVDDDDNLIDEMITLSVIMGGETYAAIDIIVISAM